MPPAAISPTTTVSTNGSKHHHSAIPSRLYSLDEPPSLSDFRALTSHTTSSSTLPLATSIESDIPIYDLSEHNPTNSELTTALQDEWHHILLSGPGVLVLRKFYTDNDDDDTALLNQVNTIYDAIIASEATNTKAKGDHFSPTQNNSRIWNSFQKHALLSPSTFVRYYSNPWLSHIANCWLGPAYQITAQVNIVRPGGTPQVPHRDYHLGFQSPSSCAQYPRSMHVASQFLTLQGAVAHSDMPLESGPTRFLPYSQLFEAGFMAYRRPEFVAYFQEKWVSSPLKMGDAVFFNPALFHAAGENRTVHVDRSANLLQISSAMGRAMESVDSVAIVERCWDEMLLMKRRKRKMACESSDGVLEEEEMGIEVESIIKAVGRGYAFPTNLDRRPPAPGGMAPESEQDLLRRGLLEEWNVDQVVDELKAMREVSMA